MIFPRPPRFLRHYTGRVVVFRHLRLVFAGRTVLRDHVSRPKLIPIPGLKRSSSAPFRRLPEPEREVRGHRLRVPAWIFRTAVSGLAIETEGEIIQSSGRPHPPNG